MVAEYCYRSRTLYPYKRPRHKNPAISVTYFCVSDQLARELGIWPRMLDPSESDVTITAMLGLAEMVMCAISLPMERGPSAWEARA